MGGPLKKLPSSSLIWEVFLNFYVCDSNITFFKRDIIVIILYSTLDNWIRVGWNKPNLWDFAKQKLLLTLVTPSGESGKGSEGLCSAVSPRDPRPPTSRAVLPLTKAQEERRTKEFWKDFSPTLPTSDLVNFPELVRCPNYKAVGK